MQIEALAVQFRATCPIFAPSQAQSMYMPVTRGHGARGESDSGPWELAPWFEHGATGSWSACPQPLIVGPQAVRHRTCGIQNFQHFKRRPVTEETSCDPSRIAAVH
jgi:hypothetical protein